MTAKSEGPYFVWTNHRGSSVLCASHIVAKDVKEEEARAIADALNSPYDVRFHENQIDQFEASQLPSPEGE